jgi:hypothetical protein
MNMFAIYDKVKPDIENIRGLNLAVVKLKTARLPLQHKIDKICIICFAKPMLTGLIYTAKAEFSVTCSMCDIYT